MLSRSASNQNGYSWLIKRAGNVPPPRIFKWYYCWHFDRQHGWNTFRFPRRQQTISKLDKNRRLFTRLASNGDRKADRNSARLPVRDFMPSGRQNTLDTHSEINRKYPSEGRWCHHSADIILCFSYWLHHDASESAASLSWGFLWEQHYEQFSFRMRHEVRRKNTRLLKQNAHRIKLNMNLLSTGWSLAQRAKHDPVWWTTVNLLSGHHFL